ncbi:PTS sugar transporter subunit IIB [Acetomicrobium sp. S15 = DSM 107314]|jgi:PTS system galactitol-specific IIB component|uniref:PTS sugar transporter subunit IIB n=1 Tax=Acetomicrobium sp. S15 = DSM 107314 TaxID=2529858 RepID=UPI0018E11E1D|nr:PTS sugar transporter subunit IIB [Acetomicrobium sp. S15 = DSM 107314]
MSQPSSDERPGKEHKIIVACGTAIATSTHVAIKVKELLQERGISVHTVQCRVQEIPMYATDADLVISTAQVPFDLDVPVVDGIPFLTGIGLKEVIDKIEGILKKKG